MKNSMIENRIVEHQNFSIKFSKENKHEIEKILEYHKRWIVWIEEGERFFLKFTPEYSDQLIDEMIVDIEKLEKISEDIDSEKLTIYVQEKTRNAWKKINEKYNAVRSIEEDIEDMQTEFLFFTKKEVKENICM